MANYPLKNKNYFDLTKMGYKIIDFNATYYTIIDGQLVAFKPIFQNYRKQYATSCPECVLEIIAANGKSYRLDDSCRIFRNYDEYLEFAHNPGSYDYYKFETGWVRDALKSVPGIEFDVHKNHFYQYHWGNGVPVGVEGEILFWVDVDGPHFELKQTDAFGRKLYISKNECLKDNLNVVEFGDKKIEHKGEYTIKREFTVKAKSQEEAESIIDEVINKAYKEQFK